MSLPSSVKVFKHAFEYKKGIIAFNTPSFVFVFDKRGNKLGVHTHAIDAKNFCDNWELLYAHKELNRV